VRERHLVCVREAFGVCERGIWSLSDSIEFSCTPFGSVAHLSQGVCWMSCNPLVAVAHLLLQLHTSWCVYT
jgi:hypothetical protein